MPIVNVDVADESKFQQKSFKLLPKGNYVFELAKNLVVEQAKTSNNRKVDVEAVCMDEGEFKGTRVWTTIALTPKSDWRLVHLALACGTQTKDEIKAAGGVDLSLLTAGCRFEASVDVTPEQTAPDGTTYRAKNTITRFLFESDE